MTNGPGSKVADLACLRFEEVAEVAQQWLPVGWGSARRAGSPPHLLVESDDPAWAVSDFSRFREAGFRVAFCPGYAADHRGCPVVGGGRCELMEGADVVLLDLDPACGVGRAERVGYPGLPVVQIVRRRSTGGDEQAQPGADPTGDIVLSGTASLQARVDALREALSTSQTTGRPAAG